VPVCRKCGKKGPSADFRQVGPFEDFENAFRCIERDNCKIRQEAKKGEKSLQENTEVDSGK